MVNDNSVTLGEWLSAWMFPAKTEYTKSKFIWIEKSGF